MYSHHAKDPAYLKLCNAFDIVRIHKFGDFDDKESFKEMCEFAMQQDEVKVAAANEKLSEAEEDFSDVDDWKKKLRCTSKGRFFLEQYQWPKPFWQKGHCLVRFSAL